MATFGMNYGRMSVVIEQTKANQNAMNELLSQLFEYVPTLEGSYTGDAAATTKATIESVISNVNSQMTQLVDNLSKRASEMKDAYQAQEQRMKNSVEMK